MKPEEEFQIRKKKYGLEKQKLERKAAKLSWGRLIIFLAGFVAIYISTLFNLTVLLLTVILFISAFFRMVYLHHKTVQKKKKAERLKEINKRELNALNHDFEAFRSGEQFQNVEHNFSNDLNIFGAFSVFRILNRTVTDNGEEHLSSWLKATMGDRNEIIQRQEATQELSGQIDLIQSFLETGQKKRFTKEHFHKLEYWAEKAHIPVSKERVLAPLFTVGSVGLIVSVSAGLFYWPVLIFWIMAGLGITAMFNKKVTEQHQNLNNIGPSLDIIDQLTNRINSTNYQSGILQKQQKRLLDDDGQAPVKKLVAILQSFDVRLNVFAAFLLNSLFLWDMHQLVRLGKWKRQFSENLVVRMEAVFCFDAFMSVGNFAYSYPGYRYPEILDKQNSGFSIAGEDCRHILIPKEERVGNPVRLEGKGTFSIITGANMAGKSTYLRTIGLNMVLAQTGIPLDCQNFAFTPVQIISSLSTRDSLVKSESFFYAEIKRLQYIIHKLENGEEVFCLLDEILKGTNSKDKQTGSIKLLRKLVKLRSNGIIATHDLKIGELENEYPDKIQNQCFEVEIKNDKLYFDYKLKAGIAQSLNASFLMRKMGITED
ncbi:MAG: hypothetical protein K9H84_04550 [Bacteroidales bacterium]|nr:hypothetical protein [Bacteroidales bacterium]